MDNCEGNDNIIYDTCVDKNFSESAIDRLKNSIRKQNEFVLNNFKKTKLKQNLENQLSMIEESNSEIVEVGREFGYNISVNCIVINNLTLSYLQSEQCKFSLFRNKFLMTYKGGDLTRNEKAISDGIILGNKIGRRLQIRNESVCEKISRRSTGKIDRRLLHELGFQSENVFFDTRTTLFKKLSFHVTLDISSSMRGEKWYKTLKLTTALAKAFSMLDGVKLQISFRAVFNFQPVLIFGYDSERDTINKIKSLFKYISPTGTTPEGLTFEALIRKFDNKTSDYEKYFINISDGMPMCFVKGRDKKEISYVKTDALLHTKKQVSKIKKMGYNVISYYVSEKISDTFSKTNFTKMYGTDASFVNLESFNQIAKDINSRLLESYEKI